MDLLQVLHLEKFVAAFENSIILNKLCCTIFLIKQFEEEGFYKNKLGINLPVHVSIFQG